MALRLFVLPEYPDQIAASKIESFVEGGAFFLDFSRSLEHCRWLFVRNSWIGFTVGLLVPIVHQGERRGGFVFSVHRSDRYFSDIRALWKARYPSERNAPTEEADGLRIIGEFARQFPEDS